MSVFLSLAYARQSVNRFCMLSGSRTGGALQRTVAYHLILSLGSGRTSTLIGHLGNSLIILTKSSMAQQGRVCTVTVPSAVAQPALFSAATSLG